jgi:glutathione S-transferase
VKAGFMGLPFAAGRASGAERSWTNPARPATAFHMTLRLYDLCGRDPSFRFSPYCWRAKMALAHKGLDVETVPTPFTGVPAIAGGASKTVPVLEDYRIVVRDSFAIALHLEAAYPDRPPLFLGGEGGVAAARFVERWAAPALHILISRMIVLRVHDALDAADQAYFRESREKRFGMRLEAFEETPRGVARRLYGRARAGASHPGQPRMARRRKPALFRLHPVRHADVA